MATWTFDREKAEMKAGITYAPELVGENPRLIAERLSFLKLMAVIAELAMTSLQSYRRGLNWRKHNESAGNKLRS